MFRIHVHTKQLFPQMTFPFHHCESCLEAKINTQRWLNTRTKKRGSLEVSSCFCTFSPGITELLSFLAPILRKNLVVIPLYRAASNCWETTVLCHTLDQSVRPEHSLTQQRNRTPWPKTNRNPPKARTRHTTRTPATLWKKLAYFPQTQQTHSTFDAEGWFTKCMFYVGGFCGLDVDQQRWPRRSGYEGWVTLVVRSSVMGWGWLTLEPSLWNSHPGTDRVFVENRDFKKWKFSFFFRQEHSLLTSFAFSVCTCRRLIFLPKLSTSCYFLRTKTECSFFEIPIFHLCRQTATPHRRKGTHLGQAVVPEFRRGRPILRLALQHVPDQQLELLGVAPLHRGKLALIVQCNKQTWQRAHCRA